MTSVNSHLDMHIYGEYVWYICLDMTSVKSYLDMHMDVLHVGRENAERQREGG